MIKALAVECLLKQPKLNNLAALLRVMVESESTHDVVAAGRYLLKIFESYHLNKLLTKEETSTSQFIYKKLLSFGELAGVHFFNRTENRPVFLQWVEKVIRIDHRLGKREALKLFLSQLLTCTDKESWQHLTNGDILAELFGELRLQKGSHQAKILALLNISADAKFSQFLQSDDSLKRKRQGQKEEEEEDDEKVRSRFEKEYERVLVDVLRDPTLPREQLCQIMKGLGDSIYRNLQSPLILSEYVLHRFTSSQDLQIKVHALAGLYILIGRYGLQLENFYDRLLELLSSKVQGQGVFENKQCKRIYKLLENALRSSKVPFGTVCQFVRVLLAEIFRQNSEFTCWSVSLVFNIFKKHQNLLSCLQPNSEGASEMAQIRSDLQILQVHFLPQVRSVLKEIGGRMSRTDFLDIDAFSNIRLEKLLEQKQSEFLKAQSQLDVPEVLHPLVL